jgi:osmotically-inducible protein OsmY
MKTKFAIALMFSLIFAMSGSLLGATNLGATNLGATTDDKIESSFKNSYVAKTFLKNDSVKIEAKNGIVTLTGTVSEEAHKSLAQETAAGLPSVTRVENRLAVSADHSAGSSGSSNDWLIAAKVKATLLFHSKVSANTDVTARNGVVTLAGTADSMDQENLTVEYAEGVDGVTNVKNDMTVSTAPSAATIDKKVAMEEIDDASITAQVKVALMLDRLTNSSKTTVKTTDGVVTLTGQAATKAERDQAGKVANDIKGVKSVKNQMTV